MADGDYGNSVGMAVRPYAVDVDEAEWNRFRLANLPKSVRESDLTFAHLNQAAVDAARRRAGAKGRRVQQERRRATP